MQYANLDNSSFICILDTVRNFMLDCKEKIQLNCHFPQINEAYDIGDNKKAILQLILAWLNKKAILQLILAWLNLKG